MKLESYWTSTAPTWVPEPMTQPKHVDVAVIGGGFTGLSAALALARRGATVSVFEAGQPAHEASGRNGGHVNNGLAVDYATLAQRVGSAQAAHWYRAYDNAVNTVAQVIQEEAIDCDFSRTGKLKLASRPAHFEALARGIERQRMEVDSDIALIDAHNIRQEVDSPQFFGGLLQKRSAQMHMGKFAVGLAKAAERHGARIHCNSPVSSLSRVGTTHAHQVHTASGVVHAGQVLIATGATRHGSYGTFGWWRRRIVPIGSFIIVTEPLSVQHIHALLSGRRTYTTTANLHHYFRTTPDNRIVFGGRARFAVSSKASDRKSGDILRANLIAMFPQLANVRVDYCWGGLVDMTQDRLPHAGEKDGLYYSMGYSGHGAQMSVHMGQCMAQVMAGDSQANPWHDRTWPAIPGHFGPPWFLPFIGMYFRMKDALS